MVDSVSATGGRVISVLEGGYSLTSPAPAPTAASSSSTAPPVVASRTRGGGHAAEDATGLDGKSGPAIVSPGTATTAATATTTATIAASHTKAKGVVKKEKGITTIPQPLTSYRSVKYAQHTGDGGLVKGVLAHVAALAGVDFWRTEENL